MRISSTKSAMLRPRAPSSLSSSSWSNGMIFAALVMMGILSREQQQVSAFTTQQQQQKRRSIVSTVKRSEERMRSRRTMPHLFMSDVPQDQNEKKKNNNQDGEGTPFQVKNDGDNDLSWDRFLKPPPKPEDQFVMTGDLLSLCIYGITDHFFCQTVSKMMVQQTLQDPAHHLSRAAASTLENNGGSAMMLQTPVWLDMNSPFTNQVLESNLATNLVTQYSPILEPMGQATCILMACWLLAGWYHEAFLFKNTLNCTTERALIVTGRTWLTTCGLLFGLVMASQAVCGCDHFYIVTRGDLDYILDSSTVLAMWRFLASFMLGSGRDED